jgi:nucleotide-binding universal stress UspA family protein
MYQRILVALDHSDADTALLPHVTTLARLTGAEIVLVHVATGWAAQWGDQLNLAESREMQEDRAYLEETAAKLRADGLTVSPLAGKGEPAREILRTAEAERCDLIAMTSHGHRFLYDIFFGSTIDKVRHATGIPILVVRAPGRR